MSIDVSVIIPSFNRLWCLPKAVESCRHTQCQVEIIVIDDGSTDGTWEWLQKQPDITALKQEGWGKCWAVNRGFEISKGKYVRFLDSDDWLPLGVIDQQFNLAITHCADVVVGGYEVYSEDEKLLRKANGVDCDDFIAQQLGECDSSHYSAYLFRKEFIKDIPHRPDFAWRDDRLFVIEIALLHPKVSVFEEPALCHRHHARERLQFPQGMRAVATHLQHLMLYKQSLSSLLEREELTPRRRRAACKVLWPLAHWIASTHLEEACEVADWVFQLDSDFCPPESGILGYLYRNLGFSTTESLLRFRRNLLRVVKDKSITQKLHQFPH